MNLNLNTLARIVGVTQNTTANKSAAAKFIMKRLEAARLNLLHAIT